MPSDSKLHGHWSVHALSFWKESDVTVLDVHPNRHQQWFKTSFQFLNTLISPVDQRVDEQTCMWSFGYKNNPCTLQWRLWRSASCRKLPGKWFIWTACPTLHPSLTKLLVIPGTGSRLECSVPWLFNLASLAAIRRPAIVLTVYFSQIFHCIRA